MTDRSQLDSPARAAAALPPLVDRFGRTLDYMRIAVNEACNLRCTYCMPAEGLPFREGEQLLSDDEIERVVRVAVRVGVRKVRLTGGEPTLRRGLAALVARLAALGPTVHLTSNGLLLTKLAPELAAAGLAGVNVSLDTLDAERFLAITRRPALRATLDGLDAALAAGIRSVKVNCVAMRGVNDDELGAFVELTREKPIGVRFIELMPFDARQIWKTGKFLGAHLMLETLRELYPALEPTPGSDTEHHSFRVRGFAGTVAIIPAYTRSLCGACNRLRITADGKIRNCLYGKHEFDLMTLLRSGADDTALIARLRDATAAKAKDGWESAREAADSPTGERTSMSNIGG